MYVNNVHLVTVVDKSLSQEVKVKITESGTNYVKWECPDCSFENEVDFKNKPPPYLHCCICNHESDEIFWKKVPKNN